MYCFVYAMIVTDFLQITERGAGYAGEEQLQHKLIQGAGSMQNTGGGEHHLSYKSDNWALQERLSRELGVEDVFEVMVK